MAGLDAKQFRTDIVRPVLMQMASVGLPLWSEAAENLLIGTALVESGLEALRQHHGPAISFYQIEPRTLADVLNYLDGRMDLQKAVNHFLAPLWPVQGQIMGNMGLATAICRAQYWRDPEPLPETDDIEGLGATWKRVWNTAAGKGTVARFVLAYRAAHP